MTPQPERCVIDGVTHDIRNSGAVGGRTECEVTFRWSNAFEYKTFAANMPGLKDRPVATWCAYDVNCVLCLGSER